MLELTRRDFLEYAAAGAALMLGARAGNAEPAEENPPMASDATWFKNAKSGVFCHYLTSEQTPVDQWNKQVDAFDVEGLAKQLAWVGTPYFFLTIGQNSGHYCSPNETYDRIVGIKPSKCSKRDLIADLAAALAPYKIRMMVYLPSGAPDRDPIAMKQLKWRNGGNWGTPEERRLVEFQRNWEDVVSEWSRRWGKNVHGWWIDGCYFADDMYRSPQRPNFESFTMALKWDNAASLVAFNPGVKVPVICHSEWEDFTAGEISTAFPTHDRTAPLGRWVERNGHKDQFHILSFLGEWWAGPPKRFSDDLAIAYTKYINAHEGVLTWDAPIGVNGLIHQDFADQLKAIRQALG